MGPASRSFHALSTGVARKPGKDPRGVLSNRWKSCYNAPHPQERTRGAMSRKKGALTPLKDVIAAILKDPKLPFNPEDADIWKVWGDVVGPFIARNAQPLRIREKRLRVRVADPIWLQELGLQEQDIREKLNRRLGRTAVERIEFRLSPWEGVK